MAISSGSPLTGALTMGVFALGTAPGLLGIGGLTAVIKGGAAKPFFRVVGLAVAFMALFNMSNGYNLTGLNLVTISWANDSSTLTESAAAADPNVTLENGYQVVRMTQGSFGYSPNKFTIKKGVPVKWLINSTNANSCASSIVSSTLGIRKFLQAGENEIDFTPSDVGQIRFSCSMGMYSGVFNVVEETSLAPTAQLAAVQPAQAAVQQAQVPAAAGCGSSGGGVPVTFKIDVLDDGSGCMGSFALPGLSNQVDFIEKGKTLTYAFTPTKTGQYRITCAMGVPRGVINVI